MTATNMCSNFGGKWDSTWDQIAPSTHKTISSGQKVIPFLIHWFTHKAISNGEKVIPFLMHWFTHKTISNGEK